jgi:hypothetical protein
MARESGEQHFGDASSRSEDDNASGFRTIVPLGLKRKMGTAGWEDDEKEGRRQSLWDQACHTCHGRITRIIIGRRIQQDYNSLSRTTNDTRASLNLPWNSRVPFTFSHTSAQSTIIALESKVTALEGFVKSSQSPSRPPSPVKSASPIRFMPGPIFVSAARIPLTDAA